MTRPVILIVEDDPNDVLLIQRAFKKANILVPLRTVNHGDEAVAYLGGEGTYADRGQYPEPILVLLDLKLPRRSGLEVLEWIRAQSRLRRLPVVVLTSSKETDDINRAYDRGANSYLVKPVGFDSLLELVKSLEMYWLTLNQRPEIPAA
ncbi:MAG TPA: response regulator [Gemmatimonadales bacterium]|nr:response regulator [Gemmatimonadales bacterium]